jgi:hypothetical protein
MLTRRSLFGALAGAVAALVGWKAKPKPIYAVDPQTGIRMRLVSVFDPKAEPLRFHPDSFSMTMAPLDNADGYWRVHPASAEQGWDGPLTIMRRGHGLGE